MTSEGLDRLKTGGLAYGHALRLIELEGPSPQAESILRGAFEPLRSAMNWLEDTSHFETAHQRLDAAGQLAREIFPHGCHLTQENLSYYQQCPVALAHNRVGMSPGTWCEKLSAPSVGKTLRTARTSRGGFTTGKRVTGSSSNLTC